MERTKEGLPGWGCSGRRRRMSVVIVGERALQKKQKNKVVDLLR